MERVLLSDSGGDFKITYRRHAAGSGMSDAHYHPYYELFYLLTGSCKMFINHSLYRINPGDVVLIPPLEIHRITYYAHMENERFAICFSERFLNPLKAECGQKAVEGLFEHIQTSVPEGRRDYVEGIIRKLQYEADQEDPFSVVLKRNHLYEVLVFLERCKNLKLPEIEVREADLNEAVIQDAAQYICTHYDKNITLSEMAHMANMSPTYFSRKFKNITGFGFKEYLNQVRIKEASKMLLKTKASVTEIACCCGFNDGNYFGDAFRKAKGMSPNQYRKNPEVV